MIRACAAFAFVMTGCVHTPPHATLVIDPSQLQAGHAVLALPTKCMSDLNGWPCTPAEYSSPDSKHLLEPTFAAYIDPALRLKLEFAGFTLADADALRLRTADRIDGGYVPQELTFEGPQTVSELHIDDVREVARSLELTSIVVPKLIIDRERMMVLEVSLLDVATMHPRWTVTCSEHLEYPDVTSGQLADCAGNAVLAVLAPGNLIGKAQ